LRHDLHIPGFAYDLRPVTLDDAEFIVQMRSDAEKTRFLHPIELTVEAQQEYLQQYFERENDYYFVVERRSDKLREGLAGIYDLRLPARAAEWGRWILRPGSFAAVESALRIYEAAFERLQLEEVCGHTFLDNKAVVSFHDRCGLERRAILRDYYQINGQGYDVVEHVLRRQSWPRVRAMLEPRARQIARRFEDLAAGDMATDAVERASRP